MSSKWVGKNITIERKTECKGQNGTFSLGQSTSCLGLHQAVSSPTNLAAAFSAARSGEAQRKEDFYSSEQLPSLQILAFSQFSSVAQSCPTLCDPMNRSTPGLPVHHQLLEFTQTHVHWISDAIQPSHPLLSPSPPAPNPSQHQSLFQWVNSSHEVAKVLEF